LILSIKPKEKNSTYKTDRLRKENKNKIKQKRIKKKRSKI
jgi:hypothetical protein